MYLAEYDFGGPRRIQVAARLIYPTSSNEREMKLWWDRFRAVLRNLDTVPDTSTSLRIHVRNRLEATLFATAPANQVQRFRQGLGSFTQLGLLARGDIEFAQARPEHDRMLSFPRFRCRIATPGLASGDAWFAFDFRVHGFLNEVLAEAEAVGHFLSYQVNVERLAMEADWQREAARNALRVSRISGIPSQLEQLQHRQATNLRHATHVCEEFLGVETSEAASWARAMLERKFRDIYGAYVKPEFSFDEGSYEESLTANRFKHFFEPVGIDEICGAAVSARDRVQLLSWEPAAELLHTLSESNEPVIERDVARQAAFPMTVESYMGKESYLFISYKREDVRRIETPVIDIVRAGFRVWYDKGIPGGAEWDSLIEERLQSCTALLLFLTNKAVQSKYVRREVKYADSLNKPIFCVRLDAAIALSEGLGMLLGQYQMIDGLNSSISEEIQRAVRFLED
jgi:TIR domain